MLNKNKYREQKKKSYCIHVDLSVCHNVESVVEHQ